MSLRNQLSTERPSDETPSSGRRQITNDRIEDELIDFGGPEEIAVWEIRIAHSDDLAEVSQLGRRRNNVLQQTRRHDITSMQLGKFNLNSIGLNEYLRSWYVVTITVIQDNWSRNST